MAPASPLVPQPPRDRTRTAWLTACLGVLLVLLAQTVWVFGHFDDIEPEDRAGALFNLFGGIALVGGMVVVSVIHPTLSSGARIALLVAGAFFAFDLAENTLVGGLFGLARFLV